MTMKTWVNEYSTPCSIKKLNRQRLINRGQLITMSSTRNFSDSSNYVPPSNVKCLNIIFAMHPQLWWVGYFILYKLCV